MATAVEMEQLADTWARLAAAPMAAPRPMRRHEAGGLEPGELAVESSNNDLLDFHGALHGAGRIGHGHLLGSHSCPQRQRERSFHVSIPAAKSRTPYTPLARSLDTPVGTCYSADWRRAHARRSLIVTSRGESR